MKPTLKSVAIILFAAIFCALVTTGCQTSKGFGKDVEKLGEKIQDKTS